MYKHGIYYVNIWERCSFMGRIDVSLWERCSFMG